MGALITLLTVIIGYKNCDVNGEIEKNFKNFAKNGDISA